MTQPTPLSNNPLSFYQKFKAMRNDTEQTDTARVGRPPKLSAPTLIAGLAYHVLQQCGTFARHVGMLTGINMSESALSERRQSLGTALWHIALDAFLKLGANHPLYPLSSYKGLRLVGVDGTSFTVANTPAIKTKKKKTKSRRGKAAFFRIGCVAMINLGTHCPLAVRIGENGESEGKLAAAIVDAFQYNDLVIADRYYGNGKWVNRFMTAPGSPFFFVRIQERLCASIIKQLSDGSNLVKINNPDAEEDLIVREIKAMVRRSNGQWVNIRFWTNLLDPIEYPASELIALYAMRWEQEIAFREIKTYLNGNNLLMSNTIITAAREICALFMAQSVIASVRSEVASKNDIPVLAVSFIKTLDTCRNLAWLMSVGKDIITNDQMVLIAELAQQDLVKQVSKPRRKRGCPRQVRQPIKKWPRLMKNSYVKGKFEYQIRKS
jgi:hypothetical protein